MKPESVKDLRAAVLVVAVGLLTMALGLVRISNIPEFYGVHPEDISVWWFVALLLAGGAAVALRGRHPGGALVAGLLLFAADTAIGGSIGLVVVMWELLHHAAFVGSRLLRRVIVVGVVVAAVASALGVAQIDDDPRVWISMALQVAAIGITPVWWALEVRRGTELAEVSAEKARLEGERAEAVALAAERERSEVVREERTAMARDLHDVISSHLSAIAIHSGAALAAPADQGRDRTALTEVRREAVASLEEMRTMVRLLRAEDEDGWASPAGLDELPALVERTRAAGLDLTVDPGVVGPGGTVTVAVPTPVAQSALRVAQEALTNALRHGAGDGHLELDADENELTLVVTNELGRDGAPTGSEGHGADGAGEPAGPDRRPPRTPSPGIGLLSMRERTEGAGGTFTAGANDGVWQVRATFPTDGAALAGGSVQGGRTDRASTDAAALEGNS